MSQTINKPIVGIIMGSDSDLLVMSDAARMCEKFGIAYEVTIVSAHRTPQRLVKYAKKAQKRGLRVIIAGAGGAAHLPGMIASMTTLPVIGVPVRGSNLEGMDSLLSIVQMPGGVPVATVAINGAKNAGILAAQILGANSKKIRKKVSAYKEEMRDEVNTKIQKLEKINYEEYLSLMPKKK